MQVSTPDITASARPRGISPAAERSRVWQLFSIVFAHPVEELHDRLDSGVLQDALADVLDITYGRRDELPAMDVAFAVYEASYIELYANGGNNGKPLAPLCAGDYAALLDGQTRPELLLRYLRFYKHFGLQTQPDPADAELPDHLVCQLECLAWLAHLEARACGNGGSPADYRLAQHDFIRYLVAPFLEELSVRHDGLTADTGARVFFKRMVTVLRRFQRCNATELEPRSAAGETAKNTRTQGLWS
jgi:DMSO reductase family type II enzyme chaperone